MRKRVFVLVGVGVLLLGLLVGTVMAQEGDAPSGKTGLFARVAELLGLGEDGEAQVKDAFNQAKTEIREERTDEKIDSLVESGTLTEEEAAELREWLESRPEIFDGFGGSGRRSFGFRRGFGFGGGHSFGFEFHHGDGELHGFEGPRFRFFFGPGIPHDHGDVTEEEVPADATSV